MPTRRVIKGVTKKAVSKKQPKQAEQEEQVGTSGRIVSFPDLITEIATELGIGKEYVSGVLRAFMGVVEREIRAGGTVDLGSKFGRFQTKIVKGRERFVPSTGQRQDFPDSRKIRFVPSRRLKHLD